MTKSATDQAGTTDADAAASTTGATSATSTTNSTGDAAASTQGADTAATAGAATTTTDPADTAAAGGDEDQDVAKWKALSRQHEARAASNAEKARGFDQLNEQVKDLTAQLAAATAELDTLKGEADRVALVKEVADKAGVPASALRGTTREELEAHAAELAALIGGTKLSKAPPATGQGAAGDSVHQGKDRSPADVAAAAIGRPRSADSTIAPL